MTITRGGGAGATLRSHPYLAAYLALLAVVWVASVTTWTIVDGPPVLHPLAQGLQFLVVAVAGTLAALRIRLEGREMRADALLGYGERRWTLSDDLGGQTFWWAVFAGIAAMLVNVLLLMAGDLLATGGGDIGVWLGWIEAGVGAGAIIGLFCSLIALLVATLVGRLRR